MIAASVFVLITQNPHQYLVVLFMSIFREGQETIIREAWGRRAVVEGVVTRDAESGRPTSVRNISSIEILPDNMPGYQEARGIVPVPDGAPSPEIIIRRLRDG